MGHNNTLGLIVKPKLVAVSIFSLSCTALAVKPSFHVPTLMFEDIPIPLELGLPCETSTGDVCCSPRIWISSSTFILCRGFEFKYPPSALFIYHQTLHSISPRITTMSPSKTSSRSPSLPSNTTHHVPDSSSIHEESPIAAYERYLRLPELSKLWTNNQFPGWGNEPILRPALQALEITFRLLSITISDPRPYTNLREWNLRLESLSAKQIELIAVLSENDNQAPVTNLSSSTGVLARNRSSQEVWKLPGTSSVLNRTSEASLLPRLAAWDKSENIATNIQLQIEAQMRRCPFTLGLGEPNLAGKPNLEYDLIVRPSDLHSLKRSPTEKDLPENYENQILFTVHQIIESWICTARELLRRIEERIDASEWETAASDSWVLDRIWKLLTDAEDLLLLMDPDDFLRLKSELAIRSTAGAFCFRSVALMEIASKSKELRRRVPRILKVKVDLNGGPRVQQAAMGLFHSRHRGEPENAARIHLLQAFQAVEAAVKRFFFAHRQLIGAVMGSLEATGSRGVSTVESSSSESPSPMYLDPPYFPSVDAAKTFLGELWHYQRNSTTRLY